jgi:hypothetical protein
MKLINRLEKMEDGEKESKFCRCTFEQRGKAALIVFNDKTLNGKHCPICEKPVDKHTVVFSFADMMRAAEKEERAMEAAKLSHRSK